MTASVTTIALDGNARALLGQLKTEYGAKNYSELVRVVFRKLKGVPDSMFGVDPDLPPWDKLKKEIRGEDRADKWAREGL